MLVETLAIHGYNKHVNNSLNDRIASLNIEETIQMYKNGK
jgi:hypothetical protein